MLRVINSMETSPNTLVVTLQDDNDKLWKGVVRRNVKTWFNDVEHGCEVCGKPVDQRYRLCFDCNQNKHKHPIER